MIAASPQTCPSESAAEDFPHTVCCTYCGLPVAGVRSAHTSDEPIYCCYGCRFAHAVVQEGGSQGAIRWTVIRLGLAIFFTMNLMAFTMTMWSLDVYDVDPDRLQLTLHEVFRWLSLVLALPVFFLLGVPLLYDVSASGNSRSVSTDLLIVVAVIAAYGMSTHSVVRGTGPVYFEVGAMVLVMITLGRWIEAAGRHRATESLDRMMALLPDSVARIHCVGGESLEENADPRDVQPGELLHTRAGERIAMDGVVVRGQTTVDEQTFSGESRPVVKVRGASLLAGTMNLDGDIVMQVTSAFQQGSFGRLLQTLRQPRESRGHYQRLADRIAAWFSPLVAVLALGCLLWYWSDGVTSAVQTSMSVLLIACPCALGLATPLAVWTSLSVAARRQVLFRSGEALERLAGTRAVCLDKTGTLTHGVPQVCRAVPGDSAAKDVSWQAVRSLAGLSLHPFSRAIDRWLAQHVPRQSGLHVKLDNTSIRTVPGEGVTAMTADGDTVRLGSLQFACGQAVPQRQQSLVPAAPPGPPRRLADSVNDRALPAGCLQSLPADSTVDAPRQWTNWAERMESLASRQNASLVVAGCNSVPVVGFLISESVRDDAADTLRRLTAASLRVCILSGDRPSQAQSLASDLNIPGLVVEGGLQPHDKLQRIQQIRDVHGLTVMVGDGINDAPALAASDVGIAMGCGADISRESADICLLSNDLGRIPWAIELSGKTRRVILQNLCWAFGYNSAGLMVAAAGWLNPAIAAALMIVSSLAVISNSLRLLHDSVPAENAVPTGGSR